MNKNKISKLGKEILEIALREKEVGEDGLLVVRSSNEKFDLSQTSKDLTRLSEETAFYCWEIFNGEKRLYFKHYESFLEAIAAAVRSQREMPTHLIYHRRVYGGFCGDELILTEYVIYYIQKPQREEIVSFKLQQM